jgi:uncharacterized protein (TIRG00374 family)
MGLPVTMQTIEAPPPRRGIPKWLIPALGYTISAVSLVWVLSRFPYATLGAHLRTLHWAWIVVAVLLDVGVYFADAGRWMLLLRPVSKAPFGCYLQSVFVGVFANDIIPARAGEAVRCFLLSYETDVPLSLSITSDIILRIMDGLWIAILYVLISSQIPNHFFVSRLMFAFGGGSLGIAALMLFVLFRRSHATRLLGKSKWAASFEHLLEEIHRLGHSRELWYAMLGSGLYWVGQGVALWAVARADDFDFGFSGAMFLLVVKAVYTAVPNAPANVGAYQAAIMYGLSILFTERPNAQIFSELAFVILTLPAALGGAIAVASAGVNITDLHKRAHKAHEEHRGHKSPAPELE